MIKTTILAGTPILWGKDGSGIGFEAVLFGILLLLILLLVQTLLVILFWDISLHSIWPTVFPCIGFGQALGLVLLVLVLFG